MSEFVDVVPVDEVDPETACVVEVKGHEVCIVHTGGRFYALANECTHRSYPVGEGDLVGEGIIECPGHGAMFSVESGEPLGGPADEPLEIYEVEVVDGWVRVAIE